MKLRALFVPLALVVYAAPASAQVLITEVQANPPSTPDDEEWVEIQNIGAAAVDISGWAVADYSGANLARTYAFPAATSLNAGQVIIVTRQATAYATISGFPAPAFELALGADDAAVPNLVPAAGGNAWALGNGGDAVVLLNAGATVVSAVNWGSNTTIPGTAATAAGASQSLGRVANTGTAADWASAVDFAVLTTPTPGVGFSGPVANPPSIGLPTRAPANWSFGDTVTLGGTVTDADGLAGVEVYAAIATSSAGNAAGNYVSLPATATGDLYAASGTVNNLAGALTFAAPTGFHDRYVRWFLYALDNAADDAYLPANAVTTANNTAFYWENVLPAATVFTIAEARAQGADERPIYEHHSVRVEGVALTNHQAFATGTTNFFIAAQSGVDAIRVFDDVLIGQAVNPGDLVRVTGKIGVFRGVRQIGRDERAGVPSVSGSELTVTVIGSAAVQARALTVADLLAAAETNESQLVEIAGLTLVTGPGGEPIPTTFTGNSSAYANDGTGTITIRIASNIDLVGQAAPVGTFTVRGILSQFAPTGVGGYQLQPRSAADVIGAPPPVDGGVVGDGGDLDAAAPVDGGFDPDGSPGDTGAPDSGVPGDGGVPPVDSGVPPADSGVPPADSGVPPADSGVTPADAGAGDAARPDTGLFGQGNGRDEDTGGCGCNTTGQEGRDLGFGLFGLLGVAMIVRRRR
ncbi:MAG: lamin tail domain-containing protein [Deltaproteobacteria bacterium]|nr:lamin tail domain-containing protein [Deltaproteobacteria bacterium]